MYLINVRSFGLPAQFAISTRASLLYNSRHFNERHPFSLSKSHSADSLAIIICKRQGAAKSFNWVSDMIIKSQDRHDWRLCLFSQKYFTQININLILKFSGLHLRSSRFNWSKALKKNDGKNPPVNPFMKDIALALVIKGAIFTAHSAQPHAVVDIRGIWWDWLGNSTRHHIKFKRICRFKRSSNRSAVSAFLVSLSTGFGRFQFETG